MPDKLSAKINVYFYSKSFMFSSFLAGNFQPSNGQFTVTANAGGTAILAVDIRNTFNLNSATDIRWQKQGATSDAFQDVQSGGTVLVFDPVSVSDAGVYATYWVNLRSSFLFSYVRLIVRGKNKKNLFLVLLAYCHLFTNFSIKVIL